MRAKQVTALMMAATLAVTGNGVTAFAEPVANVEAGDAATEALNVETTEEVETAAEVEVTEDSEDVTKSAQQDASSDVTRNKNKRNYSKSRCDSYCNNNCQRG